MKKITEKNQSRVRLSDDVDFDDLFDGETYLLAKGEDFDCSPSSAATVVRNEFRRRYGLITIKYAEDTITVTVDRGELWKR